MQQDQITSVSPNSTNAVLPAGWISVNERMPPYLSKCLVTNGEYVKLSWSKDDDNAWCEIQSGTIDVWLDDVTHWMPLPDPPDCG